MAFGSSDVDEARLDLPSEEFTARHHGGKCLSLERNGAVGWYGIEHVSAQHVDPGVDQAWRRLSRAVVEANDATGGVDTQGAGAAAIAPV